MNIFNESKNNEIRKKFDLDLKYGQQGEQWLSILGDEIQMEVKRERDCWLKTGNIYFEYECRGKPSGLAATASKYWTEILSEKGHANAVVIFDTEILMANLERLAAEKKIRSDVKGGDDFASLGFLLPISMIGEVIK